MFNLQPPRHISTLHYSVVRCDATTRQEWKGKQTRGLQLDRPAFSSSVVLPASGARAPFRSSPLQKQHP